VVKNFGGTEEKATDLFDQILKFSGYAFNKAHAASHAFIGYQTAYLKTYYPLQFMTVSLTLEKQRHDKIANLVKEFKALSLQIMKPDINISEDKFIFQKPDKVIYCLSAIKGVGDAFVLEMMKKRVKRFVSVEDFCLKVQPSKNVFESLIFSGALDNLPIYTGGKMLNVIDQRNALYDKKESLVNLLGRSLFDEDTSNTNHFDITQILLQEWKTTGVILSVDLLSTLFSKKMEVLSSGEVQDFCKQNERRAFQLYGLVLDKQLIKTKQGTVQWAVKLADQDSVYEVFVKSELYDKNPIEVGQKLLIKNKMVKVYWITESYSQLGQEPEKTLKIKIDSSSQLETVHSLINDLDSGYVNILLSLEGKDLHVGKFKVDVMFLDILSLNGLKSKFIN